MRAGDKVFAVGSPVGLENSVTSGVISALNRKIISLGEAAQIDVPVNEGNSGSPLFSENGLLEGIVFAGLPSFQNINFALPVQWLSLSLPRLLEGNAVHHFRIGLLLGKGNAQNPHILSDFDTELSAFKAGDVLISINRRPSSDIAALQFQLASIPRGALCYIEAERNFQPIRRLRQINVVDGPSLIPVWNTVDRNSIIEGLLGAKLTHLSNAKRAGGTYSVQWVCPGEALDEIGLREGDTIVISKFQLDEKAELFILELSAKSRITGYFERTIHLEFPSWSYTLL